MLHLMYGVGAVLSHIMPDGVEQPIMFVSHTLSSAEQGYAQVEKEALEKFGDCVY